LRDPAKVCGHSYSSRFVLKMLTASMVSRLIEVKQGADTPELLAH